MKVQKTVEFLERFYDLINKKQTGFGFISELEELAGSSMLQEALDDAYQAQQDLEKAKELTA